MSNVRWFKVVGCMSCPNSKAEPMPGRCAFDYHCTAVEPARLVAGYVEYSKDERKDGDFPEWCPLPKK